MLSGAGVNGGQRLGERWEVTATASRQNLTYQPSLPVVPRARSLVNRIDHVYIYGAGVNFLLNDSLRFGVSVDHSRRLSGLSERGYESTRIAAQFGYGS